MCDSRRDQHWTLMFYAYNCELALESAMCSLYDAIWHYLMQYGII